jgi:hypothetical protein
MHERKLKILLANMFVSILFARMTKHAAAPNDLVCYIVGRDFPVTRQCFFDPLHSHLPVGIQRFTLPRYRQFRDIV